MEWRPGYVQRTNGYLRPGRDTLFPAVRTCPQSSPEAHGPGTLFPPQPRTETIGLHAPARAAGTGRLVPEMSRARSEAALYQRVPNPARVAHVAGALRNVGTVPQHEQFLTLAPERRHLAGP